MTRTDKRGATAHNSPSEGASNIDKLVGLIYGKDVLDNAYASPAGRLTKKEATQSIKQLIKDITLEVIGADEYKHYSAKFDRCNYFTYMDDEECDCGLLEHNQLRTQQRAKLTKLLGGQDV